MSWHEWIYGGTFGIADCDKWPKGVTHAQMPTPWVTEADEDVPLKLYVSARGDDNRAFPICLEVNPIAPHEVLRLHADSRELWPAHHTHQDGIMVSQVLHRGEKVVYTGWRRRNGSPPFHTCFGVLDRKNGTVIAPLGTSGAVLGANCAFLYETFYLDRVGKYREWFYAGTTHFLAGDACYRLFSSLLEMGRFPFPSPGREEDVGLDPNEYAITRPWIVTPSIGESKMFFCARLVRDFRTDDSCTYQMYYKDPIAPFFRYYFPVVVIDEPSDSFMHAYPAIYRVGKRWILLYNTGRFGRDGFSWAWREET